MRIALLADIHGNLAALRAVLADVEHRAVDQIVNLGDHLSGPLQARETAELAERNGRPEWAYALRTGYAMRASA